MYLLLLVAAVRIGQEERIGWEILKRGLGESLTAKKIELLAEALGWYELARVRVTYPPEADGRQQGDATPVVYSTVFGLEQLRGPALRSARRRRRKGEGDG